MSQTAAAADLHFYFDPVCPFAWMTSKWVRMVAAARDYRVEWRFIALRFVNEGVDYAARFPPEYESLHTAGLKLLRVAARIRSEHGPDAVAAYYANLGAEIWDIGRTWAYPADAELVSSVLSACALPPTLVDAMEDPAWDDGLKAETAHALSLTGKDVGTPILQFQPPDGVAFFGPVISRLPNEQQAVELWDHIIGLAGFPGFAELKRSLRELPQLRALGVSDSDVGVQEDWHGGSRRQRK